MKQLRRYRPPNPTSLVLMLVVLAGSLAALSAVLGVLAYVRVADQVHDVQQAARVATRTLHEVQMNRRRVVRGFCEADNRLRRAIREEHGTSDARPIDCARFAARAVRPVRLIRVPAP